MDRRVLGAIVLMMLIAVLPTVFFRRPPRPPLPAADSVSGAAAPAEIPQAADPAPPIPAQAPDTSGAAPERVIPVTGPLYRYGISSRGGRLVEATLLEYPSLVPGSGKQPGQILLAPSDVLGLELLEGRDTLAIRDWDFVPSADAVTLAGGPASLVLTAERAGRTIVLTYRFRPDGYLIEVDGRVSGVGPNGGALLIGMGPGLRNTESDSVEHQRNLGIVTKARGETEQTRFSSLDQGVTAQMSGPFEWVAIKSKYFVTALFAVDTLDLGYSGRIVGVEARPSDTRRRPAEAAVHASLALPATGAFRFSFYAGPMEYPRLRATGHDFYDVNPYGWPGFRTVIRPVAVAGRWLLVFMHERLGLAYGLALIVFGVLVRLALWPLNQKAMRSSMAMQAVQPLMKDLQERHKNDPQKLQQEMFKLYKEHNVNPLGGCWPMLIPMPVLIALFFVFQNTIELRGAPFLWLNDLSRPDPIYIIPVLMGLSMYVVSKIGQLGMPPTPQTKMMLYLMPGMMTVLFLKFASGLNLYYTIQNLASIPQQWLLAKERVRRNPPQVAATKPAAAKPTGGKKRK